MRRWSPGSSCKELPGFPARVGPAAPALQRRRTTAFLCPGSGPSKRCTNITCSIVCTCCVCDHGPPLCFCCLCWVTAPLQCRPAGHFCCSATPMSPAESSPMRCFYISPTTIEPSLNTKQRSIFRAGRPTRPRCLARRSLPAGAPIIQRVLTHAATVSAAWHARGAAQRLPCYCWGPCLAGASVDAARHSWCANMSVA